jgi:hypothetical protein
MTERLDRLGLDPIAALARLAQHAEAEGNLDLAERAWRGLLPYAGPRPMLLREGFSAPEKGLPAEGIPVLKKRRHRPSPGAELLDGRGDAARRGPLQLGRSSAATAGLRPAVWAPPSGDLNDASTWER